jgi:hypothetical protein
MKKLIILVALAISFSLTHAQNMSEFSQDTGKFITELDAIFGSSLIDNEILIYDAFKLNWEQFDIAKQTEIMELCDLKRSKRFKARPHFIKFLYIINGLHSEDGMGLSYDAWIKGYRRLLESDGLTLTLMDNFQSTSIQIIIRKVLFSSRTVTWKVQNGEYKFVFKDSLTLSISSGDLMCATRDDSIKIYDVKGNVDLARRLFIGDKGTTLWDKAGFAKETTFATFAAYTLNLTIPEYKVEDAFLTHLTLFDQPVAGSLEDKVLFAKNKESVKYPKFFTYQDTYVLKDFVPGINYSGGLSMQGAHLAGTSSDEKEAVIEIFYEDTLRAKMLSSVFMFKPNSISTEHAEIFIYIETDSIYHPDVIMNYTLNNEHLRLQKSGDYNSEGPYTNSYHKMDMNFAELSWIRTEKEMKFQAALGTSIGNAWFESYDFYNDAVFNSLQTVLEYTNPLENLYEYAEMIQYDRFPVLSYAAHVRTSPSQERHRLMDLSRLGFIYFDFEKDEIFVRAKLYDYIDANYQKRDYDVIRFRSNASSGNENASLNLITKDLTINGIPNIFLSDSQNVKLVPTDNRIVMKRNRNFQFDGVIDAGLFKFYGQNFFFEYDYFMINLQNIDSLSISAKTGERGSFGQELVTTLDNKIENITGELLIDAPFNKSGLQFYPDYPVFTSREKSYIFFDEKTIQDGIYDRERFYFELEPFSIDSLDNFNKVAMRLNGTFVSADIMPRMEMEMSLRPDNSLGFYLTTPDEGLPLFDGKAIFYNDIEMSSNGLHGYGSMDYLTSTTWSDDFLFYPDSINTISRKFLEREQLDATSYPLVSNTVANISFQPRDDVMHVRRIEELFKMFQNNTLFGGNLALRPSGLSGDGSIGVPDGILESNRLNFEAYHIYSDSAGVRIRPGEDADFTLITNDVSIDVDLRAREGTMVANEDYTLIEFPANLYETRLDRIDWFMDRKEVKLSQKKILPENQADIGIDSLNINGPSYVSKHADQDSLNFIAPVAIFNYQFKKIRADEVPFIEIGDSYIFPSGGKVEILERALMSPLRMAKIMANNTSRYYNLYNADLEISSRNYFHGSAMCDYIDENGNIYPFLLSSVDVSDALETRGTGMIEDLDGFMLSPYMEYMGEIKLNAQHPLFNFSGGVRLPHACDIDRQWMKFETRIDPDSIYIPVERNIQNYALNTISASPMVARDSTHIYPAFLSARKGPYDKNMITPKGYLIYDKQTEYYEIGGEAKLQDMTSQGNYLRLETDSCRVYGEGLLDMKLDFGRVAMKTSGEIFHEIDENKMEMRMLMGLEFFFSPEALLVFGNELDSLADLEPVDLTTPFYKLGMRNMVGTEVADKLETDLGLYGNYTDIPEELSYEIFLNDVVLKWKQETNSFRHEGKVGVGMIGGVQINKKVDATIEFVDKGADIFDIYLKLDNRTWYYFAYSNGVLQALSSNPDFNLIISELSTKKRKLKAGDGKSQYVYSEASSQRMGRFLSKFEITENPIEDDFEIDAPVNQ